MGAGRWRKNNEPTPIDTMNGRGHGAQFNDKVMYVSCSTTMP